MRLILIASMLIAGCSQATMRQMAGGVTAHQAVTFCGSEEAFRLEQQRAGEAMRASGDFLRPAVGWSACRVLASLGLPSDQRTVSTSVSEAVHWIYYIGTSRRERDRARLVVFMPTHDGRPVVESVVW